MRKLIRASLLLIPFIAAQSLSAQAAETDLTGIACKVERYNPGPGIGDALTRNYIPESFIIKKVGDKHRFRGGVLSENNTNIQEALLTEERLRFTMMLNVRDNSGQHVSMRYNIYYFPENQRMSIETDSIGQFARLGSGSGSCTGLF